MRLILFTGKGGVGKSSIASATAARNAAMGRRTLLVSSDLAHNLSDIFNAKVGKDLVELAPNLMALEVNILQELRKHWDSLQQYTAGILEYLGLEDAVAEEVALLPGMDEIFLLTRILQEYESGHYDAIIVDCSPTAGTLSLLTFSDTSASKLNRLVDIERKILHLVRPFSRRMKNLRPLVPEDDFYESISEIIERVGQLGDLLKQPEVASIRLVLNPERIAVAETRRTFTYLSLFGFPVDAVLVNKVFPSELDEGYFGRWRSLQNEQLEIIHQAFLDTPIFKIPYLDHEPLGLEELQRLGESIYGSGLPDTVLSRAESVRLEKTDGVTSLCFPLPGLDKSMFDIGQKGDELFIHAGDFTRVFFLPDGLTASEIKNAEYEDGYLRLSFSPS